MFWAGEVFRDTDGQYIQGSAMFFVCLGYLDGYGSLCNSWNLPKILWQTTAKCPAISNNMCDIFANIAQYANITVSFKESFCSS